MWGEKGGGQAANECIIPASGLAVVGSSWARVISLFFHFSKMRLTCQWPLIKFDNTIFAVSPCAGLPKVLGL